MATKKRKTRRGKKTTLPLAIIAPLGMSLITPARVAAKGNFENAANWLSAAYTGYDMQEHNWSLNRMKAGALPLLVGVMAHKLATKTGLNRAIASTGIPWVRI